MAPLVATVIAGRNAVLEPQLVADIQKHGRVQQAVWLAERAAVDLFYEAISPDEVRARLRDFLDGQPYDLFIQPVAQRRKKLLVADMESTIIEQEMLDELAGAIGIRDKVSDITRRAMNGELDFKEALRERVALLKGQPESILAEVAKGMTIMPGAATLIATMGAQGARCWLVSGGFTVFADPIGARLGFDRVCANHLGIEGGYVSGTVVEPILDKNAKKDFLELACREYGLTVGETLTVGDGANDVPMLEASNGSGGLGVAYHAKPNVRAVVPHQINHGDLTALLYAQGYTQKDWV